MVNKKVHLKIVKMWAPIFASTPKHLVLIL